MRWIILILGLIYLASPIDAFPGPVDDAIITAVCAILFTLTSPPEEHKESSR